MERRKKGVGVKNIVSEETYVPKVAIAISSFQSDNAVITLLENVFKAKESEIVLVVDSLGSGTIQSEATRKGWSLYYENAPLNLGSAGNLARRMALASELGADWCYCLNHDAQFDHTAIGEMLAKGLSRSRVGAVYPVLFHRGRKDPWEDGRRTFYPTASVRLGMRPEGSNDDEVLWGSSNGALYSLAPLREGLRVWEELWMGYEDLGYGMLLHEHGWRQIVCREVIFEEAEYVTLACLWRTFVVPDKRFWYTYYNLRNLLLIQKKISLSYRFFLFIVIKGLRESAKIIFLENNKMMRLWLLWIGVIHGLLGRSGKGRYP